MKTLYQQISESLHHIADLFYPQLCAGCGTAVDSASLVICFRCLQQLPFTNFHENTPNPVEKMFWGRIDIEAATSLCYFTQQTIVQRMMHELKYRGNKAVGVSIGKLLGHTLANNPRFEKVDLLIPLPLHPKKLKIRGYNQAEVIALGISEVTGWTVETDIIRRRKFTDTQTHKNRLDRWENMKDRFFNTAPEKLADKHVLLVDDVITTGATLEACGMEILQSKNTKLSLATMAYVLK